jgi:uncharacterized phiE125 gp8 family phage protein
MSVDVRLVAPASTPAVTLAEAKAHLRVTDSAEDALITALVAAATEHLDGWTGVLGRALMPQTYEMRLDRFPSGAIKLPLGPVVSVTGVWGTDALGDEFQVDPGEYEIDAGEAIGWIVPVNGWPATMTTINAVRVRWVAGTGCPAPVKAAILLLVGHWFENREATGDAAELPLGVMALISPWRRMPL